MSATQGHSTVVQSQVHDAKKANSQHVLQHFIPGTGSATHHSTARLNEASESLYCTPE